MKNYKALLFDINGTLCDYWRARDLALKKAIFEIWLEYTGDKIESSNLNTYINFIKRVEEELREKKCTLSELRKKRFEIWIREFMPKKFSASELEKCAIDINKKYTNYTDILLEPYPDVSPTLRKMYDEGFIIIAISNEPSKNHIRRLRKMNLIKYFSNLYFSEDIGFRKPDKQFYDNVFSSLEIEKEFCLAIGDDLIDDIQGARNYGLDAVWVNRKGNKNYFNKEDYFFSEVNTLEEVCSLIERKNN